MLTTTEPTRDLGRLKFGKAEKFTIPIKNEGDSAVKIDKLILGCGSCTEASSPKTMLFPDEEVQINVKFTPGSVGNQKKYIQVRYDGNQILKLEFTAEVYA
jgi:hypothetical protein